MKRIFSKAMYENVSDELDVKDLDEWSPAELVAQERERCARWLEYRGGGWQETTPRGGLFASDAKMAGHLATYAQEIRAGRHTIPDN